MRCLEVAAIAMRLAEAGLPDFEDYEKVHAVVSGDIELFSLVEVNGRECRSSDSYVLRRAHVLVCGMDEDGRLRGLLRVSDADRRRGFGTELGSVSLAHLHDTMVGRLAVDVDSALTSANELDDKDFYTWVSSRVSVEGMEES